MAPAASPSGRPIACSAVCFPELQPNTAMCFFSVDVGSAASMAPALLQPCAEKATNVIRLKLDEVSAKISDGLPDEDADDFASDRWAGSVPLRLVQLPPIPDPKLRSDIPMPDFVTDFDYASRTHPPTK